MADPVDRLRLVSVYPSLLGTYGDGGNVTVLAYRAARRGLDVATLVVEPGQPVPTEADLYVLGGGEDDAQTTAVALLAADGGLRRAVDRGATVFAVCAGYQLLGEVFPGRDGAATAGLGLLDVRTERLPRRAVGEVVVAPDPSVPLGTEPLTGYENHAGGTTLGPAARPLGRVRAGVGNGDGTEGAWQGRLVATYLHGPGLARNPALADAVLALATGRELAPAPEPEVDDLRAERLRTVLAGQPG